jgi:UDP-glucose 4-epimerase
VTGGAGFIGANLCRELLSRREVGCIEVLDDYSTGRVENIEGLNIDITKASILDRPAVSAACRDADAVIHLAARPSVPRSIDDPVASHDVNATGTLNVLEACRASSVPVILASSCSVYGNSKTLPEHEEMPTNVRSPYAASKLAAEAYASAYQGSYGSPTLAFRFFNVYGPWQPPDHAYAAAIPAFIDAAMRGRPLTIHGDGLQTRDFTFVRSVVQVLADAATKRVASPQPVNLAFGTRITLLELVAELEQILGRKLERNHVPARPGDVRDSQAAHDSLNLLFPDRQETPLRDGLRETIAWFKER